LGHYVCYEAYNITLAADFRWDERHNKALVRQAMRMSMHNWKGRP
jgi:hypothetical protein